MGGAGAAGPAARGEAAELLPGETFELAHEVGREGALLEPVPELLEDAVPLALLVAGQVDHRHLALEAVEGVGVLVADALGEGVGGDRTRLLDDVAVLLRKGA